MSSKSEQKDNKRLKHISSILCEDLEKGVNAKSMMFAYSKDGLYFESDLKLERGDRIFIGIDNSPYARMPGTYECYHAVISRRQDLRDLDDAKFTYGYEVEYSAPGQPKKPGGVSPAKAASAPKSADNQRATSVESPGSKNRRRHKRFELTKTVDCFYKDRMFRGTIKNIAASGAFIETDQVFEIGEKLAVALPFVKNREGSMVKAEVMWKNNQGIGVKFKKTVNK